MKTIIHKHVTSLLVCIFIFLKTLKVIYIGKKTLTVKNSNYWYKYWLLSISVNFKIGTFINQSVRIHALIKLFKISVIILSINNRALKTIVLQWFNTNNNKTLIAKGNTYVLSLQRVIIYSLHFRIYTWDAFLTFWLLRYLKN